jgi:cytochrome oxidase Cu insertion factor (SCO1/SenC/PrrC family)
MRKLFLSLFASLAVCVLVERCDYEGAPTSGSTTGSVTSGVPYVGGIAPDFSVSSVNNENVTLSQKRGKVVLLAFFGAS